MVAGTAGSRMAASGGPVKRIRLTGGCALLSVITAPRLTSEPVPLVEGMAIHVIRPDSRGGGLKPAATSSCTVTPGVSHAARMVLVTSSVEPPPRPMIVSGANSSASSTPAAQVSCDGSGSTASKTVVAAPAWRAKPHTRSVNPNSVITGSATTITRLPHSVGSTCKAPSPR